MWPVFPASDYYEGSAPTRNLQWTMHLPSRGQLLTGSRVHYAPVDGGGVQLFPCNLAMGMPQAFSMASKPAGIAPTIESLAADCFERALLPGPDLPGLEPVGSLRGFHHWFTSSYTFPSRLPVPDRLVVPT